MAKARMVVELEWDADLGPAWMNHWNLEILLFSTEATRRDLLTVRTVVAPHEVEETTEAPQPGDARDRAARMAEADSREAAGSMRPKSPLPVGELADGKPRQFITCGTVKERTASAFPPDRVLIRITRAIGSNPEELATLSVPPEIAAMQYGVRWSDEGTLVFVRKDGWSIAAPRSLAKEAYSLWSDEWTCVIRMFDQGRYERIPIDYCRESFVTKIDL